MSNYITYEERMEVENCLFNGKSFGEIAKELGKDRSTISREVRKHSLIERSGYGANGYNACVHRDGCTKRLHQSPSVQWELYPSITEILQDVQ